MGSAPSSRAPSSRATSSRATDASPEHARAARALPLKRLGPFFLPILSGLAGFASFPRIALGHLAWIALDLVRNYAVLGGFPWLQIGYSQSDYLPIVQLADLTGVYGVSFLIVWVNASLALVLAEGRGPRALAPLGIGARS